MSWCPSGVQCSAALSADFNYRRYSIVPCPAPRGTRAWLVGFGLAWLPWLAGVCGLLCLRAHCPVALLSASLTRLRGTSPLTREAVIWCFLQTCLHVRLPTCLCVLVSPPSQTLGIPTACHHLPPIPLDPKFGPRGSCSSLY